LAATLASVHAGLIAMILYVGQNGAMSDLFLTGFSAKRDADVSHLSPIVCKQSSDRGF
jgi:hypothetical protein